MTSLSSEYSSEKELFPLVRYVYFSVNEFKFIFMKSTNVQGVDLSFLPFTSSSRSISSSPIENKDDIFTASQNYYWGLSKGYTT